MGQRTRKKYSVPRNYGQYKDVVFQFVTSIRQSILDHGLEFDFKKDMSSLCEIRDVMIQGSLDEGQDDVIHVCVSSDPTSWISAVFVFGPCTDNLVLHICPYLRETSTPFVDLNDSLDRFKQMLKHTQMRKRQPENMQLYFKSDQVNFRKNEETNTQSMQADARELKHPGNIREFLRWHARYTPYQYIERVHVLTHPKVLNETLQYYMKVLKPIKVVDLDGSKSKEITSGEVSLYRTTMRGRIRERLVSKGEVLGAFYLNMVKLKPILKLETDPDSGFIVDKEMERTRLDSIAFSKKIMEDEFNAFLKNKENIPTYEYFLRSFHPENIKNMEIDARFFVKGESNIGIGQAMAQLWNKNAKRDKRCEFMYIPEEEWRGLKKGSFPVREMYRNKMVKFIQKQKSMGKVPTLEGFIEETHPAVLQKHYVTLSTDPDGPQYSLLWEELTKP